MRRDNAIVGVQLRRLNNLFSKPRSLNLCEVAPIECALREIGSRAVEDSIDGLKQLDESGVPDRRMNQRRDFILGHESRESIKNLQPRSPADSYSVGNRVHNHLACYVACGTCVALAETPSSFDEFSFDVVILLERNPSTLHTAHFATRIE